VRSRSHGWQSAVGGAALLLAGTAVALAPWAYRNWRQFDVILPLAPRYAVSSDEVSLGFARWTRTWIIDYASVEAVFWPMPWRTIDTARIPARAFDTPEQRERTLALFEAYNRAPAPSAELNAEFGRLAAERIRARPIRYYVGLPAARLATLWLRPKSDRLPWWQLERSWVVTAHVVFGLFNLFVLGAALGNLFAQPRALRHGGLFGLFVGARSLFLAMLENPEPRYTLVCYPVILVAAACYLASRRRRGSDRLPPL